jgi:hypothetical protein
MKQLTLLLIGYWLGFGSATIGDGPGPGMLVMIGAFLASVIVGAIWLVKLAPLVLLWLA